MHGCIRHLAGSLLLTAMQAFGCNAALSPQAKDILAAGSKAFEQEDYPAVVRHMDTFLHDYGKTRAADEAYFLRGLARYKLKDPTGATQDLNQAVRRTDLRHIRMHASNALGDLAWDDADMPLAERMYQKALSETKDKEPAAAHARYRLGCVLQRQGAWKDSDVQFDRVIHFFPDTKLGQLAARRVRRQAWTIQLGAFTKKLSAEALVKRLDSENVPANVQSIVHEGKLLFLVQAGRHVTYEQAIRALPEIQNQVADAYVTVTR